MMIYENGNKIEIRTLPSSYLSYDLSDKEKYSFLFISGLSLMTVGYLFYHSIVISLLLSSIAYPVLRPYTVYLADKRRKELKEQFRDMLYSLSASISAGRQMPEALQEALENLKLIYKDNSMIVLELAFMIKRIQECRESEAEILKDFAERTHVEDISDFVDIYLTCRETGGDLIRILTKASVIIMDKINIEKEIRAITVQKQFEAKILTGIPLVIILLLQIASPDYLSPMYESITGRLIMTAALCGIGLAYFWSIKLTRVDV